MAAIWVPLVITPVADIATPKVLALTSVVARVAPHVSVDVP
jgi:hypothetical protein